MARSRGRLIHLTTTDMSLDWLLGPQLRAFAAAGYEVVGISAPGPHVASLEAAGIEHVGLRYATRSMAPRQDLLAFRELISVFSEVAPDIVHTHNPKPGVYGRLAARAARVPFIVNTQHGLYATGTDSWRRRGPVYALERLAATCSDVELVQNEEDLETLADLGIDRAKLVLLGNGVDLDRFSPVDRSRDSTDATRHAVRAELGIAPGEVVVGLVGRLVVEKGYREVFEAATMLRASCPAARFVVVGPNDEAKADAIGVQERTRAEADGGIRFLGRRDDVERLYAGMDLYVLASHREGFPRSAMEAAATGLAVVATDIRGCRQVVDAGETGLLVPARDPVGLAEAVRYLVADSDQRLRFGSAAAAKAVRDFDVERVIQRTLDAYDRRGSIEGAHA